MVGPYGEIREALPLFRAESRFVEIPVYREPGETVYIRYGDWFGASALFLSAFFAFILIREGRTKRSEHP